MAHVDERVRNRNCNCFAGRLERAPRLAKPDLSMGGMR